jgi:DNA-binding MarR family transcriptional regulator
MLELLAAAHRQATAAVYGAVAARHPALRPAHLHLLGAGDLDGTRLTALAAGSNMTKQSMHELVTHLEREGYLTRTRDPDDNRRRRITLTPEGQAVRQDLRAAETRLLATWRTALGEDAYTALERTLRAILTA